MSDHDETPTTRLLWVDTETTGLESDDQILEIGAIVTEADLTPVAALHTLFSVDVDKLRMSERVWKMHTANGLLDEIREYNASFSGSVVRAKKEIHGFGTLPGYFRGVSSVDRFDPHFAEFIRTHARGAPLAGSSIVFDRRMMAQSGFAASLALLHYRNFDVSTFREAIRRWAPGRELPPKSDRHRVFDDLAASIATARMARELLGRDDIELEITHDPGVMEDEWSERYGAGATRVSLHYFMGWTPVFNPDAKIVGEDPYSEFTEPPPTTIGWYAARFSDGTRDRFDAVYFDPDADQIAWRSGGETQYRPITDVASWGPSLGSDLIGVGDAVTLTGDFDEDENDSVGVWAQLGPGETFTRLDEIEIEIEISTDPNVMLDEWHDSDSRVEAYTFMGWTEEEYGHWVTDPDAHPDADPGPGPNGPSRAPPFDTAPGIPSWYAATYNLTEGWYVARFTETVPDRWEHVYFDPGADHVAWRRSGGDTHRPILDVVWWGHSVGPNWISDETRALLDEGDDETTYGPGVDPADTAVLDIPDEPIGPEPTNPKPSDDDQDIPF